MRHHAVKQLTHVLQTAAASGGAQQQLRHGGVLCASNLRHSAAFGDQQVPWNSQLLQMLRVPYCALPDSNSNDISLHTASTGLEQPQFSPLLSELALQRTQDRVPAQAAPARSADVAPPLNFDDASSANYSPSEHQQQQQGNLVPLKTASGVKKASKALKVFKLPAEVLAALQHATSSNGTIAGEPSSNAAITATSLPVRLLLQHIVQQHDQLTPWQADPNPSFQDLVQYDRLRLSGQQGGSSSTAWRMADDAYGQKNALIRRFPSKGLLKLAGVDYGLQLPKQLYPTALDSFRRFMARAATPGLTAALFLAGARPPTAAAESTADGSGAAPGVTVNYSAAVEAMLLPYFVDFCKSHYKQEIEMYAAQVATLDLRSPHTWYPYARALKRKIIYHGGPTNSGKTYNALQSLAAADRGVYCAPLRLLAMEVYETLNHRGVYCDLVTGQEIFKVPGSGHVACTVEMASLNSHVDVAVIDEIQLIGDDQRGFAWTRALLGLPANTIHVCGDTSAVALVRHLANICGDEFELHTYDRMTPLTLDPTGLPNGWSDIQPGDAVVAFSKRKIYQARRAIEAATGQKTCIVYGALPAETRRHQARLFNDPHSDANVLIASDAIGLGLNFNIRRVIFTSLHKKGNMGRGLVPVPVSLVKQIAGRAGRRNSIYPEGVVTTFNAKDLPNLRKALEHPVEKLHTPAAGLAPEYETVELLSAQFPNLKLEQLLRKLDAEARLDGKYFLCNQTQLLETAEVLGTVKGLSLSDQFTLVNAPVDAFDDRQRRAFLEYTNAYAAGHPVVFNEGLMPPGPPVNEFQMNEAESLHKIMTLWLWLSYRFEEGTFPGRENVHALARTISHWLNLGLANIQTAATRRAVEKLSKAVDAESEIGSSSTEEVDSSDADEVNEAVFRTPVVEQSAGAAGSAANFVEGSDSPTGARESFTGGRYRQRESPAFAAEQRSSRSRAVEPPVTYINWGSAVSLGLAHLSPNGSGSSSEDDEATERPAAVDNMLTETSYTAGTGQSVEVLEHLMMPEYQPGMGKFIRWGSRPKFVVPPSPLVSKRGSGSDSSEDVESAVAE